MKKRTLLGTVFCIFALCLFSAAVVSLFRGAVSIGLLWLCLGAAWLYLGVVFLKKKTGGAGS